MGVGPGRIAKVRAYGEIGEPPRRPGGGRPDRLPGGAAGRPHLRGGPPGRDAPVRGRAAGAADADRACLDGVRIFIAVDPPQAPTSRCRSPAKGIRASMLQRVVGVEGELRRFVAGYVAREPGSRTSRRPARSTSPGHRPGLGLDRAEEVEDWRHRRPQRGARSRDPGERGNVPGDLTGDMTGPLSRVG